MICESTSVITVIPQDYEVLKINCLSGERNANVICRRPDGGVSDIVVKTDDVMLPAGCPMCSRDMRFSQHQQSYLCSDDHPLVVMTTLATTTSHFKPKVTITKVVAKKKKSFFSRLFSRKNRTVKPKKAEKANMKDIKRQVAEALGDFL